MHPYPSSRKSFNRRVLMKKSNEHETKINIDHLATTTLLNRRNLTIDELAQNRSMDAKTIKYGDRNGHSLEIY